MKAPAIDAGCVSHVGSVRRTNQDAYRTAPELGVWLVADGMGGHTGGEVASALASDTVIAEMRAGRTLVEAVEVAHIAVAGRAESISLAGMGTTMVVIRAVEDCFEVAWVGDSRAYLFDGQLRQLTRDHTFVEQLVGTGTLSPEQARMHPHRHVISQAVGVSGPGGLSIDHIDGSWGQSHKIVLCSDGLTEVLDDQMLAAILGHPSDSSQTIAERMLQRALELGAPDNTTVVVLQRLGD